MITLSTGNECPKCGLEDHPHQTCAEADKAMSRLSEVPKWCDSCDKRHAAFEDPETNLLFCFFCAHRYFRPLKKLYEAKVDLVQ